MMRHRERHLVSRIGCLRAAVPGANDGIVSTVSLIAGVAAAQPERSAIRLPHDALPVGLPLVTIAFLALLGAVGVQVGVAPSCRRRCVPPSWSRRRWW